MSSVKISKTPIVKELLARTFPNYRGRKLAIELTDHVYIDPYGGGGSFSDYFLVDIATDRIAPYQIPIGGPFHDRNAFKSHRLPPNTILVEHAIFCGHDMGIRFHVNPAAQLGRYAIIVPIESRDQLAIGSAS